VKSEKCQQKATVQVVGNKKKKRKNLDYERQRRRESRAGERKRREGTAVKHDDVWIDVGV
jgi:23S rRNA maturation-related 3'-5' exoribonuclease YhaM